MPIHFSCAACGKALFAQDQYAGQRITCPACQAKNAIPGLPAAQRNTDDLLVDMEQGPLGAEATPVAPVEASYGQSPAASPTAEAGTKRCRFCAETIKAEAIKCRYCGSLLSDELRAETEQPEQQQVLVAMVALAERSTAFWRAASVLVTTATAGWLIWLTLDSLLGSQPQYLVITFNVLLILGLLWSTRQMPRGPHQVFLAAAFAVILCMPLNALLGLTMITPEQVEEMQKVNPAFPPFDQAEKLVRLLFGMIGVFFSIPLWIATLKVAAVQRMRNLLREKA